MERITKAATVTSVVLGAVSFHSALGDFRNDPNAGGKSGHATQSADSPLTEGKPYPDFHAAKEVKQASENLEEFAIDFSDPQQVSTWFMTTMLSKTELTVNFTSSTNVKNSKGEIENFPDIVGTSVMTPSGVVCEAKIGENHLKYSWDRKTVWTELSFAGKDFHTEQADYPGWLKVGFVPELQEKLGLAGCDHLNAFLLRGWIDRPEENAPLSASDLYSYSFPHQMARILRASSFIGVDNQARPIYEYRVPKPLEPWGGEDPERVKELEWFVRRITIDPNIPTLIAEIHDTSICKRYGDHDPVVRAKPEIVDGITYAKVDSAITENVGAFLYEITAHKSFK